MSTIPTDKDAVRDTPVQPGQGQGPGSSPAREGGERGQSKFDLLLASAPLAERLRWVVVDRNARKGSKPSDHAPLVAEFAPATVDA